MLYTNKYGVVTFLLSKGHLNLIFLNQVKPILLQGLGGVGFDRPVISGTGYSTGTTSFYNPYV